MKTITKTFAANITYNGFTYNTKLIVSYEHTGKQFFCKKKGQKLQTYTTNHEIAEDWTKKGLKVTEKPGYYFLGRLAIPSITELGKKTIWYINNSGDSYSINKVSKYFEKIHNQLSQQQEPLKT